jgi:hypothetical protein
MSYRKITVNDKIYEYTIGNIYTKIKTIGAFKNTEIGQVYYFEDLDEERLQVLPHHIRETIIKHTVST